MPRKPTSTDLEDIKTFKDIEAMINTPGWKVYEKFLQMHIGQKTTDMLTPLSPIVQPNGQVIMPDGVCHVLLGEAAKGAIIGLRLALDFPRATVLQGKALHNELFGPPSDEE